jgi:hypothetical protein
MVDHQNFVYLADQWMYFFYKNIGPIVKCPTLYGSEVIDILEIIPLIENDITVTVDSGGCCYIF